MKGLLKILIGLLILVIVVAIFLYTNLDRVVKGAIEEFGPRYTGTEVSVERVTLSPRSGEGRIEGLRVGNPEGFSAPDAFTLETVDLALATDSLTGDPVVINRLHVRGPTITYQASERGNNLKVLRDNVQAATGGAAAAERNQPGGRRFVIEEFVLSDAVLQYALPVADREPVQLTMPDIRLTDIGRKSGGVTAAEALAQILAEVNRRARGAIANAGSLDELRGQVEDRLKQKKGELKDELEGFRGLLEQ